MQSRGNGVCKLLLAAGVVGLLSGAHAQDDGDALAPGDDVIQYDDAYAAEPYAETVVDDPYAEPDADGTEEVFNEEEEDTAVEPAEDVYLDGPGYGFYPTEADPYDPYAEAPVEVYGPEEAEDFFTAEGPEEVVGPEEVEGPEDAEGPEDSGTLTVDGFSANAGVDYIPTFGQAVNSENIGGQVVGSQDECATICAEDPACNAASYYIDSAPYGGTNCWTKTLSVPCEVPVDAIEDPNAVLLLQTTECDPVPIAPTAAPEPEEVVDPVMAPMLAPDMGPGMVPIGTRDFTLAPSPADGDLSALGYYAYPGADYVPTPSDMPTNLVTVTNTDAPGSLETDMAACATRCDATPTCNAASYYADASLYGGNNCWLKVMGDTCELPGDAQTDAGATLLLKQDQCLVQGAIAPAVVVPTMAPMPVDAFVPGVAPVIAPMEAVVPAPVAAGPGVDERGIGLTQPPTETIDGTGSEEGAAGPVDADSTVADAGSAVSMRSAAAAVVTVAAIALLA